MSEAIVYSLAAHCHLALVDDEIVVLDLLADRYSALDPQWTQAVLDVLAGRIETPRQIETVSQLCEGGVLTAQSAPPREAFVSLKTNSSLFDDLSLSHRPSSILSVSTRLARASFACVMARRAFRQTPIKELVSSGLSPKTGVWEKDQLSAAGGWTRAFEAVRPVLPYDRVCLFDSFALKYLLNAEGLAPSWVFGVKLASFAAHCWLQCGDVVLNDELDHVRLYQPILVA